jgi:predicted site-specific integrase-resolvase
MAYTLAAAAAATGLNKTTVLRAIKSGRISGTKTELGEWLVEPAEIHRVYPSVRPSRHALIWRFVARARLGVR